MADVTVSDVRAETRVIDKLRKMHAAFVLNETIKPATPLIDLCVRNRAELDILMKIRARVELDEYNAAVAALKL